LNFRFFLELNFIIFLVLPSIRLSHSDGLAIRFGGFTRFYWCFFFLFCWLNFHLISFFYVEFVGNSTSKLSLICFLYGYLEITTWVVGFAY
jgi:hypothetical protein